MQLDFPVFVTRGLMKKGIPYTDDTEGAIEVVCETEEQKAGLLKWLMGYQGCTSEESFTPEGDPCTVAFIPNEQPVVILSVKRQEGGPSHFLSLMQNLSGDPLPKECVDDIWAYVDHPDVEHWEKIFAMVIRKDGLTVWQACRFVDPTCPKRGRVYEGYRVVREWESLPSGLSVLRAIESAMKGDVPSPGRMVC